VISLSFNLSGSVLVMVPAFNEELGIKKVLEDIPKGMSPNAWNS